MPESIDRPKQLDLTTEHGSTAPAPSAERLRGLVLGLAAAAAKPAHNHTGPLGAGTCPVCNPAEPGNNDWSDFLDLARAFGD